MYRNKRQWTNKRANAIKKGLQTADSHFSTTSFLKFESNSSFTVKGATVVEPLGPTVVVVVGGAVVGWENDSITDDAFVSFVFDMPFRAVTVTMRLVSTPAGELHTIFVDVQEVGVHSKLPTFTDRVTAPV